MANKHLPLLLRRSFAAVGILLCLLSANVAKAQPTYAFNGTSGGANVFPLGSSTNMVQWIYYANHFIPTLPGAGIITTIWLSPASSGTTNYPNLTIKMANTTTVTGMSASAWQTGLTTVYTAATTSLTYTANTWLPITLQTPFFYTGSNLILEISQTGSSGMNINQNYNLANGRAWGTVGSSAPSSAGTGQFIIGFDMLPATCSGTPISPVITSPAMNAAAPIACGGTYSITGTDPNAPITNITYSWESSLSVTGPWSPVTGGSGATTLNYTTGPLSTNTYFRLVAKCIGSGISSYSSPYLVIVGAPQPGAISGRPTFCPNDTATYSVPMGSFGTIYSWTLPSGWAVFPGSPTNANAIKVIMGGGASSVTLSVTATAPCSTTPSVARTRVIPPGSAPATPATVNGFNAICAYTTQTYSVAPVAGANSYVWTLPNGWTGTSTGPSITVLTDNSSGTISVQAQNGCGSSTSASLAVNIINSLAAPGVITSSSPSGVYCSGAVYSFSINPVPGATSYQWVLPTNWSGTANGTSVQTIAAINSGVSQIKVTAFVSCATSATSILNTPVTPGVTPQVTVTPPPALCSGIPATFIASPTNGGSTPVYQWRKNGVNVFSIGSTYTDATLNTGDMVSVRLTSNATCRSTDTVNSQPITAAITPSVTPGISINSIPVISICTGTTLNLTTTITGGGTAPLYQWFVNSNPVATSPSWSSSTINNGDTITVKLTTNAACATFTVATSNKVGVKVNPLVAPTISVTASGNVANGGKVTFTATQSGGGPKPDYQWLLNGVEIGGATGDTYETNTLLPGDHISVRMLSYDPCANPAVVTSADVVMINNVGVANIGGWNGALTLFPNPTATGRVSLSAAWTGTHSAGERVTVEVLNAIGQSVYSSEVAPGATNIGKGQWHYDVSLPESAPAGHYVLRLNAPGKRYEGGTAFYPEPIESSNASI